MSCTVLLFFFAHRGTAAERSTSRTLCVQNPTGSPLVYTLQHTLQHTATHNTHVALDVLAVALGIVMHVSHMSHDIHMRLRVQGSRIDGLYKCDCMCRALDFDE